MKKFLNKILGKNTEKDVDNLSILANAISDVGLWTWWDATLPQVFQIEFNRTQLYFEASAPDKAPSNQIALRFNNVYTVTILKNDNFYLSKKWMEDFKADKLEPFAINHECFSFEPCEIIEYVKRATSTDIIFGTKIIEKEISGMPATLGFWAGEVGLVICADEMKIYTHSGQIPLSEIPTKNINWWNYWKEYWSKIDTNESLPYDAICEITIPAERWKF
ncbi:hypothetical protein LRS05_07440 [Flavobacterium sp. J372]|uniref:hypothetical protein n=1 Tax=Flavobacterium sp. J372 TaxID=2898436 RepID=UPI0021519524|nr:hypothetical protein [Flavobacterium sp. J372]MCR5861980.1 hypothetical protein [Flavobacterium sp. J372]